MLTVREISEKHIFEDGLTKIAPKERTFLQSWEYGELQKKLGYDPLYLGLFQGEKLIKSWLFVLFRAKRGTYLFSPYGVFDEVEMAILMPFLKGYSKKHAVDFLRFSPLLTNSPEHIALFQSLGFRDAPVHLMHPELLWLLDISKTEDEILAQMRKNTRYYVKRAEKDGVTIESGSTQELLDKFYDIHMETAKRHGFVPYSKKFLDAQLEVFEPLEKIKIFLGIYQGKPISAAVIMYYGDEGVYHHGASLSDYSKIPASYLIQWEAILEAKRKGISTYNFWGVVENAPKHPWAGLSFFKQGFGGEGRYILHCQDYPITPKYWFNWLVETVRRWKRGY